MYNKKLNKIELSVFHTYYLPWRYPSNWINNFKTFFYNIKYAYQRAVYGFCDRDSYDLDLYYALLFKHSLKYFAENTISTPSNIELKDWQKKIEQISELANNTLEDAENDHVKAVNKAFEELHQASDKRSNLGGEGYFIPIFNSEEDQDKYNQARKKWLQNEKELTEYRDKCKDELLNTLKECWFDLWI